MRDSVSGNRSPPWLWAIAYRSLCKRGFLERSARALTFRNRILINRPGSPEPGRSAVLGDYKTGLSLVVGHRTKLASSRAIPIRASRPSVWFTSTTLFWWEGRRRRESVFSLAMSRLSVTILPLAMAVSLCRAGAVPSSPPFYSGTHRSDQRTVRSDVPFVPVYDRPVVPLPPIRVRRDDSDALLDSDSSLSVSDLLISFDGVDPVDPPRLESLGDLVQPHHRRRHHHHRHRGKIGGEPNHSWTCLEGLSPLNCYSEGAIIPRGANLNGYYQCVDGEYVDRDHGRIHRSRIDGGGGGRLSGLNSSSLHGHEKRSNRCK